MTYYTIYKITNQLTGKFYIGKHQTKDLDDGYMGSSRNLREDISRLGKEKFSKDIIGIYESEQKMNVAEKIFVVVDPEVSYNKCPGGKGGFGYINSHGLNLYPNKFENDIKNLTKGKDALREYYASGRHRDTMIPVLKKLRERFPEGTFKGKNHTATTIEKLKESAKGKQKGPRNSQYGSIWITDGFSNRKIPSTCAIQDGWKKGRTY